jgi:hypothetical protein
MIALTRTVMIIHLSIVLLILLRLLSTKNYYKCQCTSILCWWMISVGFTPLCGKYIFKFRGGKVFGRKRDTRYRLIFTASFIIFNNIIYSELLTRRTTGDSILSHFWHNSSSSSHAFTIIMQQQRLEKRQAKNNYKSKTFAPCER